MPTEVTGCKGCDNTAGIYGCPIHSPNAYVRETPPPFVQLFMRCPWCGKDIQLDGHKLEEANSLEK